MPKLTVNMSSELDAALERLADARGLPKTQVLRRAVMLMQYLDDASEDSDVLLRDRATGSEERLVLESQLTDRPGR